MNRFTVIAASAATVLTFAGAVLAAAHSQKSLTDAVEARHNQMELMSYNLGLLGAMAKQEAPYDAAAATAAASNLAAIARLDRSILWLEGSEQGAVADSRAKTEIWSDAFGFDENALALETASAAMAEVAGNGLPALQEAMGPVGAACGACHKAYRGPKT